MGRSLLFTFSVLLQIAGLLLTTLSLQPWTRYGGLLLVGFGLGPTVPITMTWTSQIFQPRHGQVGVAAATALVSGLGNLGSVMATYALYAGWSEDGEGGVGMRLLGRRERFAGSNFVLVGVLVGSCCAAWALVVGLVWQERRGRR